MVKLILTSSISYFNIVSRSPPWGFGHKVAAHLIPYLMSYTRLLGWWLLLIPNVTNPWVKLTLENQLVREGCQRAYKDTIKPLLNPCGTLKS